MDFIVNPIGWIKRREEQIYLEVLPQFTAALEGIADFSHIWVLYWFNANDTPEARQTLKVHPRRDPGIPLTGILATRAPLRPNPIALTACRLLKVAGNILEIADLDARDGTPLLDIKPYIPTGDAIPEAVTPEWINRPRPSGK